MAFPMSDEDTVTAALSAIDGPTPSSTEGEDKPAAPSSGSSGRPALKRIK
jgi:hypothetical protein